MSVNYFLQEKWCEEIQRELELESRLLDHCTRKYEGDVQYANKVRILKAGEPTIDAYNGHVTYEDMNDDAQWLDIDIAEKFSFKVKDYDKAQSMPGLDSEYRRKAVKGLADRRELNVGRLVAGRCLSTKDEIAATKVKTTDIKIKRYKDYYYKETEQGKEVYKRVAKPVVENISNYYEIDVSEATLLFKKGAENFQTATSRTQTAIKTAIDEALVQMRIRNNGESGYLEIDPATYGKFKDNLIEVSTNNPEMIRKGIVGMYDSYTVTRTNAIFNDGSHYHCYAHSGEAIAFVGQINEVEAMRLEDDFADGIRGLDTYGMKIVDQDQIEAILVPVA